MVRPHDHFNKKEVQNKKEKKRKEKEKRRLAKKNEKKNSLDDMIAYVDENGVISSTPPDPNKKKKEVKLEDIEISITHDKSELTLDPIRKGKVTFFNEAKGFGFIQDSETKESIFVHVNNVIDQIKKDSIVTFEIEQGKKGPIAVNVKFC